VTVVRDAIILRERLTTSQTASILIASVAVCILAFGYGHFPWDRSGALHQFWPLRIVAETVRHRCDSRSLSGNAVSPAAGPNLSRSPRQSRRADLWPVPSPSFRDPNDNRSRDRCPAALVWLRGATFTISHDWFPSVSLAQH